MDEDQRGGAAASLFTTSLGDALAEAPFCLVTLDLERRVVGIAGGLSARLGFDPIKVQGRSAVSLMGEFDGMEMLLRRCELDGRSSTTFRAGDAAYELRCRKLESGFHLLFTDASERMHVEEQLREAEGRSRWLSEATLEGVLLHENGIILDANQTLASMFGFRMDEIVGSSVLNFIAQERRHTAEEKILRGATEVFESTGVRADGSMFPVKIYGKSIPYRGRMVRVAAVRDITERKQAEEAMRESDRRYRELFEFASDLIYTYNLDGTVLSLNRSAERLTGYAQDEVIGRHLSEFMTSASYTLARRMTIRAIRGDDTPAYETEIVGKEGQKITLELSSRLLYDAAGAPVAVQGIGRDVTDRKRMEAELRYRIEFDELIAGISTHFINLAPEELDSGLETALEKIGRFVNVDRAYVFLFRQGGAEKAFEWVKDGITPQPRSLDMIAYQSFPWFTSQFADRQPLYIPRTADLGEEARRERKTMLDLGIKTMLAVPMVSGKELLGFLGFDSVREEKEWTDQAIAVVKLVGEAFVNALQRQRAEEALLESEERYKLAALGANDGLWDWNLKSDEIYYSPRWKSMLGLDEADVQNRPDEWFSRIHKEDLRRVQGDLQAHLEGKIPHFESEYRIRHKDEEYRWMLCRGIAVRDVNGRATRMAGSQTDISVRKAAEERLYFDAFHDSLTGLPNRALFVDRLEHAIRRSVRKGTPQFAVLFLDLDRFKIINDSLGHSVGDQFLISISRRLESCLRPGDTLARLGGDEFVVLVEEVETADDAITVADRILRSLDTPFNLNGQDAFTSASIGIAMGNAGYEHPEELLRDADTAMYRAKALGKSRYALFDAPMRARAMEVLRMETELRRAVEREDFQLLYQPIIRLSDGRISGFEALLRWHHPLRGLMLTSHVIPLAEETGLIVPIGRWVMREASKQMKKWQKKFGRGPEEDDSLKISVNLSAKQFVQSELLKDVQSALDESGLDPRTLRMEITESVLMENADMAMAVVSQLKVMNINLHIDDFGTGYSSLSYLHRFPIDTVKIDRSFVARMSYGDEVEIVRTITTLAHHLGKTVIAEGVETEDQLQKLRELKCEQAQGYFFAKPLEIGEVEALLRRDPRW